MAAELTGLFIVFGIAVAVILLVSSRRSFESTDVEQGLPAELRGASLVHAEETFRSASRRVVARLDRAYELAGELVLVEFKTRQVSAAYMTDVIELSVQRVALQDERNIRVSRTAWVITEVSRTGARASHRVQLLEVAEVVALRARYFAVEGGAAQEVHGAKSHKQCLHCGHRSVCVRVLPDPRSAGGQSGDVTGYS